MRKVHFARANDLKGPPRCYKVSLYSPSLGLLVSWTYIINIIAIRRKMRRCTGKFNCFHSKRIQRLIITRESAVLISGGITKQCQKCAADDYGIDAPGARAWQQLLYITKLRSLEIQDKLLIETAANFAAAAVSTPICNKYYILHAFTGAEMKMAGISNKSHIFLRLAAIWFGW